MPSAWHEALAVTEVCGVQVNEFVKRVRAAKIHIMIMGHLRKQMPAMMGKQKAQDKLLRNLADHFSQVQREHHLPLGEALTPGVTIMRMCLVYTRLVPLIL